MHGQEGSSGRFGEFHEIFPAILILTRIPHDALDLFVIHVTAETAHSVAFDEGDHVVFYRGEIVWNGRHIGKWKWWQNVIVCRSPDRCQPAFASARRRGRSHQIHEHAIEPL